MNDFIPTQSIMPRVLTALVVTVVPLASFLAFSVQPMLGKQLLPIYGGSAGTWLGTMVFFQLALLLGYGWAAWLVRCSAQLQVGASAFLALVAVIAFHLPSTEADGDVGIGVIVWRLSLASLPAMMLLFSISPLMHGWLQRRGQEVPYYLYAISNTGSLAALVLYPFLIETNLRISDQALVWQGLLVVVAGLLSAAGFVFWRGIRQVVTDVVPEPDESFDPIRMGMWLGLSALTCMGMLGATHYITAEIGSVPLAWVGPFGVYLFSFTLTFCGHWRSWMTRVGIAWLAMSLTGYMLAKGFTADTVNGTTAWWLLSLTASGSLVGNALLHDLRPARRFERYYLVLAAGGVLGGLLSSLVIPHLLVRPIEFVLVSVALLATAMVWLMARRDPGAVAITVIVLAAPVLGIGLQQIRKEAGDNGQMRHSRNLYAHIMVKTDDHSLVLSSETTTHGSQITSDAAARRHPTLYYTESTGIGRTLTKLQATHASLHVGTIGLGAGTLAAYARKADTFDFWDIDPQIIRVAHDPFSFVTDSLGRINITQCDGRKGVKESKTDYDVIVIDAFSGDGIPAHLITREAMQVYFNRLKARNGVLLVHATSRYSKLLPVVATTARTLGYATINIATAITEPGADIDWDPTPTQYILVCRPEQAEAIAAWFLPEEDKGRVKHTVTINRSTQLFFDLNWSDGRNATLDAFDLGRYFFE